MRNTKEQEESSILEESAASRSRCLGTKDLIQQRPKDLLSENGPEMAWVPWWMKMPMLNLKMLLESCALVSKTNLLQSFEKVSTWRKLLVVVQHHLLATMKSRKVKECRQELEKLHP